MACLVTSYGTADWVTAVLRWANDMNMKYWEFPVYFQERRGVILQHYNEVKSKNVDMAACNQEPSSSAPERIMELDSAHPTSSVEHLVNDLSPCQLVEAVLSHCVEQEEARSLLQKLYESEFSCNITIQGHLYMLMKD